MKLHYRVFPPLGLVACAVVLVGLSRGARADLISSTNPEECGSLLTGDSNSDDDSLGILDDGSSISGSSGAGKRGLTSGSGHGSTSGAGGAATLHRAKFAFGLPAFGALLGTGVVLGTQGGGGSVVSAISGSNSGAPDPAPAPAPVPEPGTMSLMAVGLAGLVTAARRKKRVGGDSDAAEAEPNPVA